MDWFDFDKSDLIIVSICIIMFVIVFFITIMTYNKVTTSKRFFDDNYVGKAVVNNRTLNLTKKLMDNVYWDYIDDEVQDEKELKQITKYINNNITYNNTFTDYPNATTVLDRGEARCVGKSILFVSLIKSYAQIKGYEVNPQYVFQANHVCVGINFYGKRLIGCNDKPILDAFPK